MSEYGGNSVSLVIKYSICSSLALYSGSGGRKSFMKKGLEFEFVQHFFMNARELILLGCIVRFSRLFHPSNRLSFYCRSSKFVCRIMSDISMVMLSAYPWK